MVRGDVMRSSLLTPSCSGAGAGAGSGIGVVHQSNGQSLPLSRSWNRAYLMTGMELDNRWVVNARLWKRIKCQQRRQPGHQRLYRPWRTVGVLEHADKDNTLGSDVAQPLNSSPAARRGWKDADPGHRLMGQEQPASAHPAVRHGDSMIDCNRKRTVFTVGLSLVDF